MPVSARVGFVLSDRRQISLSSGVWVSANVKVSVLCAAESDASGKLWQFSDWFTATSCNEDGARLDFQQAPQSSLQACRESNRGCGFYPASPSIPLCSNHLRV